MATETTDLQADHSATRAYDTILYGSDLRGQDFRWTDLRNVDLAGRDLTKAYLSRSDLRGARLHGAILRRANLRLAILRNVDMSGANLKGADLRGADLSGTDLRGAKWSKWMYGAPRVRNIDAAILTELDRGGTLDMKVWHKRDMRGCRATWAVVVAGKAGRVLEAKVGTCAAAALIYASSRPEHSVPDFFASSADAMADLRSCAAR